MPSFERGMVFFIDADPNDVDMPLMTHRQIGVLQNGKCQAVASLQLSASRQTLWLVRRENWMNQQVDIPHTKKRRKVGGAWVKRRNISYFYSNSTISESSQDVPGNFRSHSAVARRNMQWVIGDKLSNLWFPDPEKVITL